MPAAYEAKARITVDTSQLLRASREAARSIGTLTAATREATAALNSMERAGRNAAQAMRPFSSMMKDLASDSRTADNANQQLSQGLRENTQAFNAAADSSQRYGQAQNLTASAAKRMAREIVDTDEKLSQVNRAMDVGINASGELDNAYTTLRQRLQSLRQAYDALDTEQRDSVRSQMNLITAQREATQAARDADAAIKRMNAERMEQVRIAVRAAQQEEKVARATSDMARGLDQAARSAGGLDSSMWALRSSVGEIEGMLFSLQSTAINVGQALATNFSAQEMAIAQISRVSQATVTELDGIVNSVRQMSHEIPIAFDELGRIAMLGSQVGISNDALANFTETVALFSATSEVSAEDTSQLLARIMQMADVPEDEVMNLGSAVAFLGSNSAATDAEILKTIESIATIGNQAGLSEVAIIGLGGAMASLRIRPELARGAMQRVFNQLEQGARGTGAAMEKLTDITDLNQSALVSLLDEGENSDEFFFTIIEGLSRMHEEGTNLVPVLREMGVINTRDVDVLARLAANWDVLSQSIEGANTAFQDGTYLYDESDRIFNTLTARVQVLANVWNEFLFNAVAAVAPFITSLVEGATAALEFLDAIGAAPLVGFAALALAAAAALGTLGIAVTTVTRGWLAMKTAQLAVQRAWTGNTVAVSGYTAAMVVNSKVTATNTTTQTANTLAMSRAIGTTTGLSVATTGLAASTARATAAMRAFALAHPVLAIAGIAAAVAGATAAFSNFNQTAGEANAQLIEANRTHIDAAGGIKSLQAAIQEDTATWREAQVAAGEHLDALDDNVGAYSRAAQELKDFSAFRTLSAEEGLTAAENEREAAEDLSRAQEDVAGALRDVGGASGDASSGLAGVGDAASDSTEPVGSMYEANENLRASLEDSISAYDDTTAALGIMSYEWGAAVANSALMETAAYDSADALRLMKDAGVDMGNALALELQEAGQGAEYLEQTSRRMYDEMSIGQKTLDHLAHALQIVTLGMVDLRSDEALAMDATYDLSQSIGAVSAAAEAATESEGILLDTTFELADGTEIAASELAEMDATALIMDDTISGLGITVDQLREGFASFIDPLQSWNDATREAQEAAEDTSLSLLNMEGGFSAYLDKLEESGAAQMTWAQNLLQLSTDGVPAEVIAGLTEMGAEGAEIVQGLVDASDEDVARFVASWQQGGGAVLDSFSIVFSEFMVQAAMAGDQGGVDFANNLLAKVGDGKISMGEAVDEMTEYAETEFDNADPTLEFYGDATEALEEMNSLLEEIRDAMETANAEAVVEPSWSSGGFWGSIGSWWSSVKSWWNSNVAGGLSVSPQVTGDYSGGGTYGPLPRADGGWVSGPGGPREDKIHALLSDREFVVNARSAQEFGPLLEWINRQNGSGSSQILTPNFVPDDIFRVPRRPLSDMRDSIPTGVRRSLNSVRRPQQSGWKMTINNNYPQAEPTSVTVNRALAYAAALEGVD